MYNRLYNFSKVSSPHWIWTQIITQFTIWKYCCFMISNNVCWLSLEISGWSLENLRWRLLSRDFTLIWTVSGLLLRIKNSFWRKLSKLSKGISLNSRRYLENVKRNFSVPKSKSSLIYWKLNNRIMEKWWLFLLPEEEQSNSCRLSSKNTAKHYNKNNPKLSAVKELSVIQSKLLSTMKIIKQYIRQTLPHSDFMFKLKISIRHTWVKRLIKDKALNKKKMTQRAKI